MWEDSTIRISYDNADKASKAQEADRQAWSLEDDGFENIQIMDEPCYINEGTSDVYQDGGQFVITWT